eukprot:91064-Chlamydomonas_euryale.AAC.2
MAIYERMLAAGVQPSATTYTVLISSYGKRGQVWKCGRQGFLCGRMTSVAGRAAWGVEWGGGGRAAEHDVHHAQQHLRQARPGVEVWTSGTSMGGMTFVWGGGVWGWVGLRVAELDDVHATHQHLWQARPGHVGVWTGGLGENVQCHGTAERNQTSMWREEGGALPWAKT